MKRALLVGLALAWATPAYADWPCAGETLYRIARGGKDKKPIAIAATTARAVEKLEYGALRFEDLNGDGKRDLLFQSSCIKGVGDSVRWHRVLASCGPSAVDGGEDYVVVYEEEELCTRTVQLSPAGASAKPASAKPADAKPADAKPADTKPADAKAATWREIVLARKTPREGTCVELTTERLAFNGVKYAGGARTYTKKCPAK